MDWWEWVTWGGTALIAAAGLVLGIRAERRVSYRKHWVVVDGPVTYVINRSREDATRVNIEFFGADVVSGSTMRPFVEADKVLALTLRTPERKVAEVGWRISWTRPLTEKRYHLRSKAAPEIADQPERVTPWTAPLA
ncbi:hypothetical protein GCM10009847_00870 [Leucobacter tardus]